VEALMDYSQYLGINIGSGPHYAEGWWNTDIIPTDSGKQPDQLIDIHDFANTYPERAFKKAYVGHVLEHIKWDDLASAIQNIAYIAEKVMVVGPCMDKAETNGEPESLLEAIRARENPDDHPWGHKWTPTELLTVEAIMDAGFTPHVVSILTVKRPEWPNPSTSTWQTAMWFTP
jgi:predicted SAM-dependent methyltransferase